MNVEGTLEIIVKLSRSVNELESTVMEAYDYFVVKYGPGHKHINRLESYFSAIDKQREYIEELELCVKQKDLASIYFISNKIVGISEMIKNDAKALLFSISSENFDECVNETVH